MKKLSLLPVVLFIVMSCSKSDPEPNIFIDSATLDIKFDKEHQYVVMKGSETLSGTAVTWKSSDTLVGKIDNKGLFKGRKIGQTTITGQVDGKTVESKVTISPYSTLFKEPYLVFGSTAATIKANDKRTIVSDTPTSLTLSGENGTVRAAIYLFDNLKMKQVGLFFENSSAAVAEVTRFYNERYPAHGLVGTNAVFLSDDRTYGLIMSVNATLGYNVIYSPSTSGGRMPIANDLEDVYLNAMVKK